MENGLAQSISLAQSKAQYNENAKRILSHKVVLAWILRYTVAEFEEMSLNEIKKCIEGEPEVSVVRVDSSARTERISGNDTADIVPEEGCVFYDVRFCVYLPGKEMRIKLLLNVEAQKSFYPGYEIVTRGVFYGSRMISAQLGTEFEIPNYDGIKKVYSIWLCMNVPQYIGNAISEYAIAKEDLVPGIPDKRNAYDKMVVIMICLNEKQESENKLLKMLNVLFSQTKPAETKKKELKEEYHIEMDSKLEKEVELMCNLADLVEERGIERGIECGIERGIECGIERGIEQGIEQGARAIIEMCQEWSVSMEETLERLVSKLAIDPEKAEGYIKEFWK